MNNVHTPGAAPADTGADAWEAIYQADDAGWDLGQASPALQHLIDDAVLPPPPQRILVPGCGTGHDALALAEAGYEVIAMDFAPSAVAAAQERAAAKQFTCIEADALASDNGVADASLDLIFEHTFFCALRPEQREDYARSLARMLRPGGEVFALSMRTTCTHRQPYDSTPQEYTSLLEDAGFLCLGRESMDEWSHQRRKGRETLVRLVRMSGVQTKES